MSRPKGSTNRPKLAGTLYKASLKIFGKYFRGEGRTALEAVQAIKPGVAKGMSVLTLEKDGVKKEQVLSRFITANLFGGGSPMRNELAIKLFLQTVKL